MDILIFSVLTNFIYFCSGSIFINNKKSDFQSQFYVYIIGVIIIAFFSLLLNFFTSLNQIINSILYFLIVFIFAIKKGYFFDKRHVKFLLISSFITFLLIIYSTVNRPDAGLYHLPYTSLIQENKIVIGASNIHFRFGHVSILQYLSAINNNYLFLENGISIPLASIISFFFLYFFFDVYSVFTNNSKPDLAKFFSLFIIIYISFKITNYSSFGNDAIGHFCFFYIVSCILKDDIRKVDIKKLLLISVFAFINKPTLAIIFIIPVTVFFIQDNLNIKKIFKIFFSLPFFLLYLWIIKNILVSGCAIFPIKITCFQDLTWTNIQQITDVNIEENAWSKGWPDRIDKNISMEEFIRNFNWFKTWTKIHLKYILNIIVPYVVVLIFSIFYIKINCKKLLTNHNKSIINRLLLCLITSGIGVLCFLFFFSIYRYGYSYIITFIILITLIIIKNQIESKRNNSFFKFIFICCLTVIITKSVIKIYTKTSQNIWPNIYTLDIHGKIYKKSKINHGNDFFYYLADKGDQLCMYSTSPCTSYPIKKNIEYKKRFTYMILKINNSDINQN
jgi:hypothetical protein